MIIITSTNYTCRLHGYITKKSKKIHRNTTISTNGVKQETYVRNMKVYNIIVSKCDQTNYDILLEMFENENSFTIEDTDRNIEDGGLFINSDEFSLSENENKKEKGYYYTGNISLDKY